MKEVKSYEARNGKIFKTKEECLEYEEYYSDFINIIIKISNYCSNEREVSNGTCCDCPFCCDNECILENNGVDSWQDFFD
jgi:hypothetical protein